MTGGRARRCSQAQGRLRATHDLAAFMHESCPPAALKTEVLRSFVMDLSLADLCMQQLFELEWVCEASDHLAEAAFWRVQREMFAARRVRHERELESEADADDSSGSAGGDD